MTVTVERQARALTVVLSLDFGNVDLYGPFDDTDTINKPAAQFANDVERAVNIALGALGVTNTVANIPAGDREVQVWIFVDGTPRISIFGPVSRAETVRYTGVRATETIAEAVRKAISSTGDDTQVDAA
ncbi:MAG: hypothetical protein IT290_11305 [Deltaproteobacteria bacterium]|nr:hypothetical protein [Deltaproteobacteria bacterium]